MVNNKGKEDPVRGQGKWWVDRVERWDEIISNKS